GEAAASANRRSRRRAGGAREAGWWWTSAGGGAARRGGSAEVSGPPGGRQAPGPVPAHDARSPCCVAQKSAEYSMTCASGQALSAATFDNVVKRPVQASGCPGGGRDARRGAPRRARAGGGRTIVRPPPTC